ncbi:MAG: Hpt domain-containing protein [Nitrospira sp.]
MMPPEPEAGLARIVVHIDPDLEPIIPGFLANRRRDLVTIEGCLKHGDLDTIRMLGHRMKGDGGGYGFNQISTIGDNLEQAVMIQDGPLIERQIALLDDFLSRVDVVYLR